MTGIIRFLGSVRGRLTVAVTVLFAVVLVTGSWLLLDRARDGWVDDLRAQDLAELETLAEQLATIEGLPDGTSVPPLPLPVGADGTTFTLTDDANVVVGATPIVDMVVVTADIPADELPQGSDAGPSGWVAAGPMEPSDSSGTATEVSIPVVLDSGVHLLSASTPLASVDAGVDSLRATLWLVGPGLVIAVAALAWFVTGRAFRPVEAITDRVEKITDGRLDDRVPVPSSRDEVAHLAKTMNSMLDRLETSRRRQREFVSDASHELRTPISTTRTTLEVALSKADAADWPSAAQVALDEQERLASLVDDLLLLARLDEGIQPDRADVDLDDIVQREARRPHHATIDVTAVEPARLLGDERLLVRMVGNLLDNATRYGEGQTRVSLRSDGADAVLVVEDNGPGIPIEDRDRVLERFVRSDDARTRTTGGSGLGLAIVAAVAERHGGHVAVGDSDFGGAKVTIRIPNG